MQGTNLSAGCARKRLIQENGRFLPAEANSGNISPAIRRETAEKGQFPYAVVVTCSDSRVPPEHIFQAGVGELFVIRTAGNVIGDYELGSIEYGAAHLHASLVVVLGHTHCGAVAAALAGGGHDHIKCITDEISACLPEGCTDPAEAEIANIHNSIRRIKESPLMASLIAKNEVEVLGAVYDIATGKVEFLNA